MLLFFTWNTREKCAGQKSTKTGCSFFWIFEMLTELFGNLSNFDDSFFFGFQISQRFQKCHKIPKIAPRCGVYGHSAWKNVWRLHFFAFFRISLAILELCALFFALYFHAPFANHDTAFWAKSRRNYDNQ